MNLAFLKLMSGPLAALLRYGVTTGGGILLSKGVLDASATQAVVGAGLAIIPAVIGALTSTVDAKIATTAALPNVRSVNLDSGAIVRDPANGVPAYASDRTMNDPNAG